MRALYNFFGGKSVTFALTFTIAGLIGFFTGRLSGAQFLTFAGIIHGWVAVRSMMDDLHTRGMAALSQQLQQPDTAQTRYMSGILGRARGGVSEGWGEAKVTITPGTPGEGVDPCGEK